MTKNDKARLEILILAVSNVARSRDFYRQAFDWEIVVEFPIYVELATSGGAGIALYDRAEYEKNLKATAEVVGAERIATAEMYVRVDDMAKAVEKLKIAGAQVLKAPQTRDWGEVVAYFRDPDGHVIALACPADS